MCTAVSRQKILVSSPKFISVHTQTAGFSQVCLPLSEISQILALTISAGVGATTDATAVQVLSMEGLLKLCSISVLVIGCGNGPLGLIHLIKRKGWT